MMKNLGCLHSERYYNSSSNGPFHILTLTHSFPDRRLANMSVAEENVIIVVAASILEFQAEGIAL